MILLNCSLIEGENLRHTHVLLRCFRLHYLLLLLCLQLLLLLWLLLLLRLLLLLGLESLEWRCLCLWRCLHKTLGQRTILPFGLRLFLGQLEYFVYLMMLLHSLHIHCELWLGTGHRQHLLIEFQHAGHVLLWSILHLNNRCDLVTHFLALSLGCRSNSWRCLIRCGGAVVTAASLQMNQLKATRVGFLQLVEQLLLLFLYNRCTTPQLARIQIIVDLVRGDVLADVVERGTLHQAQPAYGLLHKLLFLLLLLLLRFGLLAAAAGAVAASNCCWRCLLHCSGCNCRCC